MVHAAEVCSVVVRIWMKIAVRLLIHNQLPTYQLGNLTIPCVAAQKSYDAQKVKGKTSELQYQIESAVKNIV